MANQTLDYIGFTFAGYHTRDFKLVRVSSGNRYDETITPAFKDTSVEIPGANRMGYLGTTVTSRTWTINVAFDNMSEYHMSHLKKHWTANTTGELIFDELPFKAWDAKLSAAPQFKYLSFVENGARVYKGEASLAFIAYCPYAHTPTKLYNASGVLNTADGRVIDNYNATYYTNKNYWSSVSNLQSTIVEPTNKYRNCGDLPAPMLFTIPLTGTYNAVKIQVGTETCVINLSSSAGWINLTLDTNIGVAIAHTASVDIPVRIQSGNPLMKLPVATGGTVISVSTVNGGTETAVNATVSYKYWYC